ncbi:MAG: response regulator transcription factor [Bacteroidales bacterium]|nr:response regulator transcription factor [Bacteroidales bacterium]
MDIQLMDTDGAVLTLQVKKQYPEIKIIALTMFGEIEYFNKMISAGADGYMLKKVETNELFDAIKAVMEDRMYVCKEFRHFMPEEQQKENKPTTS